MTPVVSAPEKGDEARGRRGEALSGEAYSERSEEWVLYSLPSTHHRPLCVKWGQLRALINEENATSMLTSYDGQVGEREHELYANGPETVSSRDPKKLGHQAMCTSPYSAVSRAVDLVFSQLQPTKASQFPSPHVRSLTR